MSFRDISRRPSKSKTTPPRRQLSDRSSGGASVGRAQKQSFVKNSRQSSVGSSYSTQQSGESSPFQHNNDYDTREEQHLRLSQQREEDYALQTMREREQEIQDINRKMHVVNEIYKDLGQVVEQQQEKIDIIEDQFGMASDNTRRGLEQLEKANSKQSKSKDSKKDGEEEAIKPDHCQWFFMKYIQHKMNSIGNMVSVCGGSASAKYSLGEDN